MSDKNNEYVLLDKELLEQCLKELAKALRKRIRSDASCELSAMKAFFTARLLNASPLENP